MKIENFEEKVNKDIINMYNSSLEYYNRNIRYALDALRNGELTEEQQTKYFVYINKLKERRAKLIKTIKVLNSRAKKGSVLAYGEKSKYKIIGDDFLLINKNAELQKEISLSLHQDRYNQAVLDFTGSKYEGIFTRRRLEKSILAKENMLNSIQQNQLKIILDKAVEEGCANFGLTYQEFEDYIDKFQKPTEQIDEMVNLIQITEFMNENGMTYKKEF